MSTQVEYEPEVYFTKGESKPEVWELRLNKKLRKPQG